MKSRYKLFRRGGVFYCQDNTTGKQESLKTKERATAMTLLAAKNEAARQPFLNLRIAQTYLAAADPQITRRTWANVMEEFARTKRGKNQDRTLIATKQAAFDVIRDMPIVETQAEHFLKVLQKGTVSTNNYLRRFHNFALGMNWLPWPVLPKKQWPAVHYREKRAITREEHFAILGRERNEERRAYYDMCWHIGGSQTDMANLKASDVDWHSRVISFFRAKTGSVQIVQFGPAVEELLRKLPRDGLLFPNIAKLHERNRSGLFQMVCRRLKIKGLSLHSYRYAWAERAKVCGYPERFAQQALGHNSKAVHRAYAKKAQVTLPSLEQYEREFAEKLIKLNQQTPSSSSAEISTTAPPAPDVHSQQDEKAA